MEWNDKEKKIIEQLQNHTESVDTESLWRDIQPNLQVRRKRMWLPFFLFFLGGLSTGIGGYYLMDNDATQIPEVSTTSWAKEKAGLLQQLKTCLESKITTVQTATTSFQQPSHKQNLLLNSGRHNQTNPITRQNLPAYIPAAETTKLAEMTSLSSTEESFSAEDDVMVVALNQKTFKPFENKTTILVEPIFSKPTEKVFSIWLKYLMAGAGPTFVTDRLSYEKTTQKTVHRPMYHYALEYGFQQRLFKNLMANIGINYTGTASHILYQTTKTEEFPRMDTIGYFIGPDGVISAETGDILVTKVTKKTGKTFQYNQSFFIHPSLEYDIFLRKSTSLSVKAGLMIPLISWQKNSFLTPEGDILKLSSSIRFFEGTFFRGGLTYNKIVFKKTTGFYLDFLLGTQKLQAGSYNTVRTIFLPQTGMRMFF